MWLVCCAKVELMYLYRGIIREDMDACLDPSSIYLPTVG